MMPETRKGTLRDALDAFFPLSPPGARACEDYTDIASLSVPCVPVCELWHDWRAEHPKIPRREKSVANRHLSCMFLCLPGDELGANQLDPLIYSQSHNELKPLITLPYVAFERKLCYSG